MNDTIQNLITESFDKVSKDHIFMEQCGKTVTAAELKCRYMRIASAMNAMGISKGTPVALVISDRIKMIEAILGTIMAGCCFVPVETDFPQDTVSNMLVTAGVKHVLTDLDDDRYLDVFEKLSADVSRVDSLPEGKDVDAVFLRETDPNGPIYIYFTSGTTGKPKGIIGRNRGLAHFIEWEASTIGESAVSVSQLTSPCHDPFLRDIFLAIKTGGKICIPEGKSTILDGKKLATWMKDSKIQVLHCTPSVLNHMLSSIDGSLGLPDLRFAFLAGEKVVPQLVKKWFSTVKSNAKLMNLYGPTETTLAKFCYEINPSDSDREMIPLGKPIPGATAYILKDNMQLCEKGEKGEIYICTEFRSLGYIGDDELNRTSFVPNPFEEGTVMYKTGDMGRLLEDGNTEFLGRSDGQVKIRGNRVELGAIEARILEMDGVRECALVFNDDDPGNAYIAAYIASDREYQKNDVVAFLKIGMPEYMIPTYIVFLEKLPLNNNMKLDKKQLPDPRLTEEEADYSEFNETQRKLAEACAEILGIKSVSLDDNFFTLGGTSLKIMTLISRVYELFCAELSLEDVFFSESIEALAEVIDNKRNDGANESEVENGLYTTEVYGQKKSSGYRYTIANGGRNRNRIEGIDPFNEVFYRSCVYNSVFAVMGYYGAKILPVFTNDVILYCSADKLDGLEKMNYIEKESLENVLLGQGIELKVRDVSGDILQEIISCIDKGHPVIVGIDCFYETIRSEFYQKANWSHNVLVYGYDNDTQEMCVIEHSGINNLDYRERRISYLDLDFAYHSNRSKFSGMEQGRYFMEFSFAGERCEESDGVCCERYLEHLGLHWEEIKKNQEVLPGIYGYLRERTGDLETVSQNSSKMISILDGIIEAKNAQIYLYQLLSDTDKRFEKPIEVLTGIVKKWKLIRNVIYRSVLTSVYSAESFENALGKCSEITELENELCISLEKMLK